MIQSHAEADISLTRLKKVHSFSTLDDRGGPNCLHVVRFIVAVNHAWSLDELNRTERLIKPKKKKKNGITTKNITTADVFVFPVRSHTSCADGTKTPLFAGVYERVRGKALKGTAEDDSDPRFWDYSTIWKHVFPNNVVFHPTSGNHLLAEKEYRKWVSNAWKTWRVKSLRNPSHEKHFSVGL